MAISYTPRQLATILNVSTTTLRRYEVLGLIPEVPRTASNRRQYTSLHLQAFVALRALMQGYDIPVVYDVMRVLKNGRSEQALWAINARQYNIQVEKHRIEEVLKLIRKTDFTKYRDMRITEEMRIGEVAAIAGVNPSAIRHWEKEGLIRSERNPDNGYRVFTSRNLKKIIVLSSLRKTVYFIEGMRTLLEALETNDLAAVERSFQVAEQKLDEQLAQQMKGISEMMSYIEMTARIGGTGPV